MENAKTFGFQAKHYREARPNYPDELFEWIAGEAQSDQLAWDVGTGSGQAALSLTKHFKRVHATDLSAEQISQAVQHPVVTYEVNLAHLTCLKSNSADAITVATALHWFNLPLFWKEVGRVAKENAIFCAWCYAGQITDEDVEELLFEPIRQILKPYWSAGNDLSLRGYDPQELGMPFRVVSMPDFACDMNWTPAQIVAFIRSWSGHQRARLDGHEQALLNIEQEALARLGDNPRRILMPLKGLAARVA